MQVDLPFLPQTPALDDIADVHSAFSSPSEWLRADPASDAAIVYVRVRRARRYILRVRVDGTVRVTIPRGGTRTEAVQFVRQHLSWIHRERSRVRTTEPRRLWVDGSSFLFRGAPATIRLVGFGDELRAMYSDRWVRIPSDPPVHDLRPFIERDLQDLAREELPPRLVALAGRHELTVTRVTIRSQRSRWGSCSPSGCIALNFRLIQLPPSVSDYVLLHELMHLKQQNHSIRYWRLVERACPWFRDAERWLKKDGRTLF